MRRLAASVAVVVALAGCDQTPVEAKRSASQIACVEKATALFPAAARIVGAADDAATNESDADVATSYRLTSTGKFVAEMVVAEAGMKLTCTGDFNAARLETVALNGVVRRPTVGEAWGF